MSTEDQTPHENFETERKNNRCCEDRAWPPRYAVVQCFCVFHDLLAPRALARFSKSRDHTRERCNKKSNHKKPPRPRTGSARSPSVIRSSSQAPIITAHRAAPTSTALNDHHKYLLLFHTMRQPLNVSGGTQRRRLSRRPVLRRGIASWCRKRKSLPPSPTRPRSRLTAR
jgi:hypothetical protein